MRKSKPKTWTYAELTAATEKEIKSLLALADESKANGCTRSEELYRQWAYGTYLNWERITCGWRENGDDARMEALTQIPQSK